jgi:hypothetical protein
MENDTDARIAPRVNCSITKRKPLNIDTACSILLIVVILQMSRRPLYNHFWCTLDYMQKENKGMRFLYRIYTISLILYERRNKKRAQKSEERIFVILSDLIYASRVNVL